MCFMLYRSRPPLGAKLRICLLLPLLTGSVACGLHEPIVPGTRIGADNVSREVSLEFESSLSNRILDLQGSDSGELLLITSERVVWYPVTGEATKEVSFSPTDFLFPASIVGASDASDASKEGFIGMASDSCVLWLDASGKRVGCYPSNPSGEFATADIDGDGQKEVIVETTDRKGVAIYRRSGQLMKKIPVGGYLSALDAMDADADGKVDIILQIYPDRHGSGRYQVINGDGTLLHEWAGSPVGDLEPVPWPEKIPAILALEEDRITVTALTGTQLRTMPAPGVGALRYLQAVLLPNGYRVVVASGGGYRPYHMVAVFTTEDELIYQRFDKGRAYGLAAPIWAGHSFFVAVGHQVWCYTLRAEEQPR